MVFFFLDLLCPIGLFGRGVLKKSCVSSLVSFLCLCMFLVLFCILFIYHLFYSSLLFYLSFCFLKREKESMGLDVWGCGGVIWVEMSEVKP